jgi:squalene-associated FAD-dependent desaturase
VENLGLRVTDRLRVAVIGGGWAGCSAAAELSASGHEVVLLEATGELGGRARRLVLELDGERHVLDNGQHLLIGAYRATATLLASAGVDLDSVVVRRPFSVGYPDGMRLTAARLPAPWHLIAATLTARGLAWDDTIALAQFLPRARALDWTVAPDRPAEGWLRQLGQTPRLIERLWRPLTLAALNTPLHEASAQILASVLRDSLGAHAGASEMWLPRSDLSAILPDAVERLVRARGGVRRHHRVDLAAARARVVAGDRSGGSCAIDVDAVVYAAPAAYVQRIFGLHADALRSELMMIDRFRYEPITTVYLKYAATEPRLPPLMHAMLEDPHRRHYGQWVFNRGELDADNAGVLALVISTGGTHEEPTLDGLCERPRCS